MKTNNLFILLTLLLSMVGLKASAYDIAAENTDGVMIYYSYSNENELSVTYASDDYNSYSGAVVIPEEVTYKDKTLKVTNIGLYAFYGCSGLTSIEIPNSVTLIENHAFDGCTNLQKVIVRDIAAWCKTIIMDEDNPLAYAHHIYSDENTEITDLVIPDGVTHIGHYAFYNCSGLTSVTIPSSVASVGNDAFDGCTGLQKVIVQDIAAWCKISFDNLNANPLAYAYHIYSDENTEITDLVIPYGVTHIGHYAFYNCSGLTSVTIPSSVASVGNDAFDGCTGLQKVIVQDIAAWCKISFDNLNANPLAYAYHIYSDENTEITDLVIPNGVTSIGKWTFLNCSGLTSVMIPNSVTSIGYYAFAGCTGLQKVIIQDIAAWCKISFKDDDSNPLSFVHHLYSDENTEIKDLVIPNDVTSIGKWTFEGCSGLTSVEIPSSVTSIGEGAFWDCSGLTSVTIPNSVTSIKNATFWGCSGLTSIEIPNSVTSIGEYAFANCFGLTFVEIPNSVTSISYDAFAGCSNLTSVKINSPSIGAWFQGNNFIESVIFGENMTSIGNYAFYGCAGLTSLTIPNSVTSIGAYAFQFCTGLTSLTIPNSVVSIGDYAFNACTGLSSISVEQGNSVYDSRNNCNAIIETSSNTLLVGCKTTVIPNSVTSIGNGVFINSDDLTSIEIPNSVTSIGNQAFTYCHDLMSIKIPSGVTSIGEKAFWGCPSLTSVTMLRDNPVGISSNVFPYRANATLYVPVGSKTAYEAADYWKEFKEIVEINPTGIQSIENTQSAEGLETGNWYTLDGRLLNGKPTQKGIYIVNGYKVVIK